MFDSLLSVLPTVMTLMKASLRNTLALLLTHAGLNSLTTLSLANAQSIDHCPGYNATNISNTNNGFTADLVLAGAACNVYGPDLQKLSLSVVYETSIQIQLFYYNHTNVP